MALSNRLGFEHDFFEMYGGGPGLGLGQGEYDFTKYLIESGRISGPSGPGSLYWSSVDGDLITNMFLGAADVQGGFTSGNHTVQHWVNFIEDPAVATFWIAHNDSIFTSTKNHMGLFNQESGNERAFIEDALWALNETAEIQLGNRDGDYIRILAESILGPGGGIVGDADMVAHVLFATCQPDTPCLGWAAQQYPGHYPAEDSWFHTPIGLGIGFLACTEPGEFWCSSTVSYSV